MKAVQSDMTTGSPMKIIFNFTLPIFIGNVFQQFYNMADAVIVGKFVGNKALAAVGSTGTIMFLIYGFVVGMTAGFTVLTAQKFGAGDMPAMRRTVVGASFLSLVVGLVLTAAFMVFMKPWLVLMHTPEDIFADAYAYIMIISAGILAQMLYNPAGIGKQQGASVFSDSGGSAEYCAGSGTHHCISYGSGRSSCRDGDFPGNFRSTVSVLHNQKGPSSASDPG